MELPIVLKHDCTCWGTGIRQRYFFTCILYDMFYYINTSYYVTLYYVVLSYVTLYHIRICWGTGTRQRPAELFISLVLVSTFRCFFRFVFLTFVFLLIL